VKTTHGSLVAYSDSATLHSSAIRPYRAD